MFRVISLYQWLKYTEVPGVWLEKFVNFQRHSEGLADVQTREQLQFLESSPGLENYQYILHIPKGRLLGAHGYILTPDNYILKETSVFNAPRKETLARLDLDALEVQKIAGRHATMASEFCGFYYHWLIEIAPKLQVLEQTTRKVDGLIRSWVHPSLFKQTLALFPLEFEQITVLSPTSCIEVDELVYLSYPHLPCSLPNPAVVERYWSLVPRQTPGENRLYISRRKTLQRHLVNEEELRPLLESHGFKIICMEDYSLSEQFTLASEASVFLGVYGSGLTNAIFAPPEARVYAFKPQEMSRDKVISNLMETAGRSYREFELPAVTATQNDLYISPGQLQQWLRQMECASLH